MNVGRHPCLWCTITSEELPKAKHQHPSSKRTLESLANDLHAFRTDGNGDLKKAKNYNNVIDDYYFNIPIDQV